MLPSCRHFPDCGGCQILDLEYSEQLIAKEEELRRHFTDWPDLAIEPVLASPRVYGYRHKVQLPFGLEGRGLEWKDMKRKGMGAGAPAVLATVGCYAAGSHVVVDQEECLVQDPGLSQAAWAVRNWANAHGVPVYREDSGEGWLRHLLLRKGATTGEILLGLVTNGPGTGPQSLIQDLVHRIQAALASPEATTRLGGGIGGEIDIAGEHPDGTRNELVGIVQSLNSERNNVVLGGEERLLWGRPQLKEFLGPFSFPVGMSTFFQVNPFQTPRLYDLAVAAIPAGADALDLYSGLGSIALWASRRAGFVLGIEANPAAVDSARLAARENGIANVEFLAANVARALTEGMPGSAGSAEGGMSGRRFDVAIVDPPRKGLEASVRESLCKLGLTRLIYVSCFPPTLARDAKAMAGTFRLVSLAPVDMFPHTRHVECVAIFDRV